jgi:hypothetical protein
MLLWRKKINAELIHFDLKSKKTNTILFWWLKKCIKSKYIFISHEYKIQTLEMHLESIFFIEEEYNSIK